jgi:hypothetical protein
MIIVQRQVAISRAAYVASAAGLLVLLFLPPGRVYQAGVQDQEGARRGRNNARRVSHHDGDRRRGREENTRLAIANGGRAGGEH